LTILALASSSSPGASTTLETFAAWLQRKNRIITVGIGLIFGTWFFYKGLHTLDLM
jgi:hypothetical protein